MNTTLDSAAIEADKIHVETGLVPCELPIFVCKLDLVTPQLQLARQALDELRISHPESTPSNVHAVYMSPWNSHEINPKLQPLCDAVVAIAQSMAQSAMGVWFSALNMELYVAQCWGIFYEDSDHTLPHSHFPAEFACAIYLDADEGCAPIIFSKHIAIRPKPASMVLFPGIVTHEVPANKGRRVVISMNLFKRPAFAVPT